MNRIVKALSFILVLTMLIGAFSACKGKEKGPEDIALEAYNAIKTDVEKLFYVSPVEHPSADKTKPFAEMPANPLADLKEITDSGKTIGAEGTFNLNTLEVGGDNLLQQLGGQPIKLKGSIIANSKTAAMDMATTVAGLPLSLEVASNEKGMIIKSPFAFQKPYYIPANAIGDITTGLNELAPADGEGNQYLDALSKLIEWAKEKLTKESLQYIQGLLKDAIPVSSVSTSTVTLSDLKGSYIKEDVDADCVTLNLDGTAMDKLYTNLSNNVLTDAKVKDIIVSLGNVLADSKLVPDVANGETFYNELTKSFKDFIKNYDAKSNDATLVLKRYYVKGFSVKNELVVTQKDEKKLELTAWNLYKDSARECGIKLVATGAAYWSIVGGADANTASFNANLTTYTTGVSIGQNGEAAPSTEVQSKLNLSYTNSEKETKLNGILDIPQQKNTASFDVTCAGKEITGSVVLKEDEEKVCDISILQKAEDEEKTKLTVDATVYEGGAEHKAKATVDMHKYIAKGKDVLNVVCNAEADEMFKLSFDFLVALDKDSSETVEEVDDSDCFVLNGRYDLPFASNNFTPLFKTILENAGGQEGDPGEDISGDYSSDESFDYSFDDDFSFDFEDISFDFEDISFDFEDISFDFEDFSFDFEDFSFDEDFGLANSENLTV